MYVVMGIAFLELPNILAYSLFEGVDWEYIVFV